MLCSFIATFLALRPRENDADHGSSGHDTSERPKPGFLLSEMLGGAGRNVTTAFFAYSYYLRGGHEERAEQMSSRKIKEHDAGWGRSHLPEKPLCPQNPLYTQTYFPPKKSHTRASAAVSENGKNAGQSGGSWHAACTTIRDAQIPTPQPGKLAVHYYSVRQYRHTYICM